VPPGICAPPKKESERGIKFAQLKISPSHFFREIFIFHIKTDIFFSEQGSLATYIKQKNFTLYEKLQMAIDIASGLAWLSSMPGIVISGRGE
jgi:hypothetical protein